MAELEKEGGGGGGTGKKSPHSDTLSSSPQRIIQETLLPPVMSPVSGTEKPHDPVRHAREVSHFWAERGGRSGGGGGGRGYLLLSPSAVALMKES